VLQFFFVAFGEITDLVKNILFRASCQKNYILRSLWCKPHLY